MKKILTSALTAIFLAINCSVTFAVEVNLPYGKIDMPQFDCIFTGKDYLKWVRSNLPEPYSVQILRSEDRINWEVIADYTYTGTYSLNTRPPIFSMAESTGTKVLKNSNIIYVNNHYIAGGMLYNQDLGIIRPMVKIDAPTIKQISVVDDVCYVTDGDNILYSTSDFENWEEVGSNQSVPYRVTGKTLQQYFETDGSISRQFNLSSDKLGKASVVSETEQLLKPPTGDYFVSTSRDGKKFSYSKDGIYWTTISSPGDINSVASIQHVDDTLVLRYRDEYYQYNFTDLEDALPKSDIYVKVNGEILGFETPPILENDRTLVPMRFILEKMGADVGWYDEHQMVVAQQNNMTVEMSINNPTATVNGKSVAMDVPPRLINGRTMIPLRFLSEELGYSVQWDDNLNMAIITSD